MARLQDFQSVTPSAANDNLLIVQAAGQGLAKIDAVGQKIATDTTISSLNTSSKKIAGAINEVNTAVAGKQSTLNGGGAQTNLNSYTTTGFWAFGNNVANTPFNYGIVLVMPSSYGYVVQVAFKIDGTAASYRSSDNSGSTWSAWKSLT